MSAPSGSTPPHNQSASCSNCLGIPDNPFGRPRMMLNMDMIESSSESEDDQSLDTLSEFGESSQSDNENEDEIADDATTSSELANQDSGQCSDANVEGEEEDEYDRIFNRGVSKSSCENSADETDESEEIKSKVITDTGPSTQQIDAARLESNGKRRSDDKEPDESQSKLRRQEMQKAVNGAGEFMQKSMFMFDPAMGQPTTRLPASAAQQFFSYLPQEMTSAGSQYAQNPLISPYMNQQHNMPMSYVQEEPTQLRKLFIGGLNHETTDDQLKDYYSKWGTVIDCIVIRDPTTKHSRGFGFVTYTTIKMAEAAMDARPHTINGKVVDPKRAIPREHMLPLTPNNPPHFLENEPEAGCKLTLQGIHWDYHTVDGFRQYFEQFGEIEQVEIVGHPRGYGFIVFEDKTGVERCLQAGKHHAVNGKKVEVKECSASDTTTATTQVPSSSTPAKRQFNNPRNQRGVSPADHYHQQRPNQRQNYHNQIHGNVPKHQDNNKRSDHQGTRPFVPQNNLVDFPHLGADRKNND